MLEYEKNKRKFKRVIFSPDDDVCVNFYIFKADEIVTAKVLNISRGGICFAIDKKGIKSMPKIGDELVLLKLESPGKQSFLINADLEIIWALIHSILNQIGFGCRFEKLPENSETRIEEFLDLCRTRV